MEVRTKAESYRLYEAGIFGNKIRSWNSLDEVLESGYAGEPTIRYKEPGSPFCRYDIPLPEIKGVIEGFVQEGADRRKMVFNESCPNDTVLVQGELMHGNTGWHLFYSLEKGKPMREVLKNGMHARGLAAIDLIKRTATLASYEDIRELFVIFPDSVVEFGIYRDNLGVLPRRNAVIWEVRNY